MEKIVNLSGGIPIFLAFLYLTIYNFIDTEIYIDCYHIAKELDNFLICFSTVCFLLGGYKKWNAESLRCFSIVIMLNILTELSTIFGIANYYKYYLIVLYFFCFSFVLTFTMKINESEQDTGLY